MLRQSYGSRSPVLWRVISSTGGGDDIPRSPEIGTLGVS